MSNVNEIMICYKAWQYHKIEINIKKKKAFSHATYTNTFETWSLFPNISVFTAVSSLPIFFLGNVQYEDWIKVKRVVFFSLRFFFPRDKFWCKNLSSSNWFLKNFLRVKVLLHTGFGVWLKFSTAVKHSPEEIWHTVETTDAKQV